ncbi:S26 family signal peptidase [Methylocapsa palsarum]|uniref:Conjugative transfer signal peptidase TraF n=1 Tax=Methylocapsa palsarum TaxID=1612308 RepID=A0A1I4BMY1_9HYPH|nr:S26 family signal peptidase [Methylocapsa palsarum]SFK69750.1 conjugative transfer signal peptidase TraF [Methylocapsa palsarum]
MSRRRWVLATVLASLVAGSAALVHPSPKLIWNASASAPIGLYALRAASDLRESDLVAVIPPEPVARFLDERGYLPQGVPLMKRILALPGQMVCREGVRISVDGAAIGEAQARDRRGRDLPEWQGCRRLADAEVFLMNPVSDSLDGRYLGPFPASSIIGRAAPLWTDETGDERFVWRAATR